MRKWVSDLFTPVVSTPYYVPPMQGTTPSLIIYSIANYPKSLPRETSEHVVELTYLSVEVVIFLLIEPTLNVILIIE